MIRDLSPSIRQIIAQRRGAAAITRTLVSLCVFVLFGTQFEHFAYGASGHQRNGKDSIRVTLPSGLYLYRPAFDTDNLHPLLLVQHGKVLDPYRVVASLGIKEFSKRNGNASAAFNLREGAELLGTLRNVAFSVSNHCESRPFLADVKVEGNYDGKALPGKSTSIRAERHGLELFKATRVVATPADSKGYRGAAFLTLTADDASRMSKAFRAHLLKGHATRLKRDLRAEGREDIREGESHLFAAEAVDLDGNGKTDFLGIYTVAMKHGGISTVDVLFALRDSGKVEEIASDVGGPAFALIGVLDMNADGIQEVAFQVAEMAGGEGPSAGRRIHIMRHTSKGWRSLFRSGRICGPVSFGY